MPGLFRKQQTGHEEAAPESVQCLGSVCLLKTLRHHDHPEKRSARALPKGFLDTVTQI